MSDWAFRSAIEQAAAVRAGHVRCRDLVEDHLHRIAEVGAGLNAVVTVDADMALRTADERDRAITDGVPTGPLHGVPMTVKDCFETVGMRTTSGSPDRGDHVPHGDAVAVARLRAAGVVIMGKTNLPEDVTGQETANVLFGRTNNPWDAERTTGGSSGGGAAALAAGLTALELGSDSGGSIRQPASYCGVYGHFPTQGIVPAGGHLPQVERDDVDAHIDLMAVGPLARDPGDLAAALDVLAGPDRYGQRGWRLALPPPRRDDTAAYRVAVWPDDDDFPVAADVCDRILAAAGALRTAGVTVADDARPGFRLVEAERVGFDLWVSSSSDRTPDDEFDDLLRRAAVFADDDERREARRARAETMRHRDWLLLDAERRRLQRLWDAFFDDWDVLLCPVTPTTAPPHDPRPDLVDDVDHRLQRHLVVEGQQRPYLDQLVWTTAVGLARLPSTVVPVGADADGMPVGMQIVGRTLDDRTTLDVAARLAEIIGGFRRPPGF